MRATSFFLFVIIMLIVSCSSPDEETGPYYTDENYPTIITALSDSELYVLQTELDSIRSTDYKASLDKYGMLGSTSGLLERGISTIEDADHVMSIAKLTAKKFSKFTNITDTSNVYIQSCTRNTIPMSQIDDWTILFKNQKYDDLEVLNTSVFVLVTDDIIQILMHYYKEIYIPEDRIDQSLAENSVIGAELEYYGLAGIETFVVTIEMLHVENGIEQSEVKILPVEKENTIEMRVCWRVPVYAWGGIYPDFNVFVDALSGEIVEYQALFICKDGGLYWRDLDL